jgi:hypothetical protein
MDELEQERHEMIVVDGGDGDTDRLYCPTCGRLIVVQWTPEFVKTIVEPGDENALHTGGIIGLQAGAFQSSPELAPGADEANRLEQWDSWLDEMDFSDLWDRDR